MVMVIGKKYIGIPFEKMNCWELICHYYGSELGIVLPSHEKNYRDADDKKTISRLYESEIASKTWPRVENPKYPDVAVFRIAGYLWHAGLILNDGKMLHTQRGCDSVIESFRNARWKNRLYGFYRYQPGYEG